MFGVHGTMQITLELTYITTLTDLGPVIHDYGIMSMYQLLAF